MAAVFSASGHQIRCVYGSIVDTAGVNTFGPGGVGQRNSFDESGFVSAVVEGELKRDGGQRSLRSLSGKKRLRSSRSLADDRFPKGRLISARCFHFSNGSKRASRSTISLASGAGCACAGAAAIPQIATPQLPRVNRSVRQSRVKFRTSISMQVELRADCRESCC